VPIATLGEPSLDAKSAGVDAKSDDGVAQSAALATVSPDDAPLWGATDPI